VAMPRIGCGLAGGTWEEIEPIIRDTLSARAFRSVSMISRDEVVSGAGAQRGRSWLLR
jgi:hypothetical protein